MISDNFISLDKKIIKPFSIIIVKMENKSNKKYYLISAPQSIYQKNQIIDGKEYHKLSSINPIIATTSSAKEPKSPSKSSNGNAANQQKMASSQSDPWKPKEKNSESANQEDKSISSVVKIKKVALHVARNLYHSTVHKSISYIL